MKTEVRRGRKFVEYIDDSLPVGTFVQEIGAHDVSYQETDGSWHPADENWATDGADGFILKNDKLNHKVRLKGTGGRTWYPRRNVNTEYMTFGVPQYWNGKRWANFGFTGWSVEGKTITLNTRQNVTVKVHSRWNGIKIDWILNNANAPVRMRYPVSLTGITYVDGIIYGADGTRLGQLTPTTATDANEAELPCTGTYANGYVEFSADVTGAVYPVTIDPDFAGASDAYIMSIEDASYAIAQATSGTLYNSQFLNIGSRYFRSKWVIRRSFLKFDTSSIADTATIAQVNLKLTCASDDSTNDFDVQIVKQDWSSQDPLASGNQEAAFDGCLTADADDSVWRNTNGISTNTTYTSGNLSTAWVNKTGATYYSMRSSLDYSGTASAGNVDLCSSSHLTASYRPVLIVAYGAGGTAYSLECAAGSYSLAGVACTLTYTGSAQNLTLSCGAGSLALTGSNATFEVKRNFVLSCESGGVAYPNIVVSGAGTSAVNGTYVQDGTSEGKPKYKKADNVNLVISAMYDNQGWILDDKSLMVSYYISKNDVPTPDLATWETFEFGIGSLPAPTVTAAPSITYTLTGSPVTLTVQRNYTLACGTGSYALTGSSASFEVKRNYTLACNAGSYALSGSAVTFAITRVYTLACGAGSYSLTGTDISFGNTKSYELVCGAGSYALTGSDVSFVIARNYSLSMGAGSYSLTGTDCTLSVIHTYSLACSAGSYAITGTNAALTSARSLACNSGAYVLTGLEADLFKGLVLPCGNGSYILTSSPATINSARTFAIGMGSYVLVGTDAGLYILTITPDCRTYFIDAENRTLLIGSEDRTHTIDAENRTMEVRCH